MTETKDTQFDALFNVVLDIMPRRDEDFADHAEWFAKELFDRGVRLVSACADCRKDLFKLLKNTDNEQTVRIEGEEHKIIKRTVSSDADCADCICRVCAASALNDSENSSVEKVCYPCNNCEYGSDLYETEEDCPDFASEE